MSNTATVTLDAGPAALGIGANGYTAFNTPYVTITICAPGSTTNCQTIDHVILDTGSIGMRIIQPVLNASLLAALPTETDQSGNPVGECYQYVDSYVFGSVRQADFKIAGETVANMPIQAIADTGAFAVVPSTCSSGGGSQTATVQDLGANAILGIGTTKTDCGTICETAGNSAAAIYYDCPASGCSTIIARSALTTAPFQQLPNPVAAFAADNNGIILTLPSAPQVGLATLTGTVTFGIGTQADNSLNASNILELTTSTSRRGPGLLTATYNGHTLPQSYVDSGTSDYFFVDAGLPACTQSDLIGFYCPTTPLSLLPTLSGSNGMTASGAFTLYNPNNVAASSNVAPGLGLNPTVTDPSMPSSASFVFGMPFYFGRTVYTAIEGSTVDNVQGPFVAY